MEQHNGLVECALEDIAGVLEGIAAGWKSLGGAAGLVKTVLKGISATLAWVAFLVFGLSFADGLLWILMATPLLGDNVGRTSAFMAVVRFAYDLGHPLSFFLGIFTNFFFIDVLIGDRHVSRRSFTIPFIGVAAQIAVYTVLAGAHAVLALVWRPINGNAAGCYELCTLLLVAGKAAYLFWLNSGYNSFLETKYFAETQSEGEPEEDDPSEELVEPESANESVIVDWVMECAVALFSSHLQIGLDFAVTTLYRIYLVVLRDMPLLMLIVSSRPQ